MAITLRAYSHVLPHGDRLYRARACGRQRDDGMWEGWIEFDPTDKSAPLRSGRETTQPNQADLDYWATGLSRVYLEGVLERALRPVVVRKSVPAPPPAFDGPAPSFTVLSEPSSGAVLDPYSVYQKSPDLLRQELRALQAWHLRQIVRVYDLADVQSVNLEELSHDELAGLILQGVTRTL